MTIENIIKSLQGLGFFSFIIPFVLTTAIVYGLLRKSKIFGEPEKNVAVNATIAISIGFLVCAAPILAGIDIKTYLAKFLAYSFLFLIFILVIIFAPMIVMGTEKYQTMIGEKWVRAITMIAIVIAFLIIFTLTIGYQIAAINIQEYSPLFVLIGIIVILMFLAFYKPKKE